MVNATIEQSGSFKNAIEDVNRGHVQIAVVEVRGNCHVVVSKEMTSVVQEMEGFIKDDPEEGLPTFYVVGSAASVIEKLSKGLLDPEVLPKIGEERTYLQGQIVVLRRPDDYMAYIFGDKSRWEAGDSISEAIGKLVKSVKSRIS